MKAQFYVAIFLRIFSVWLFINAFGGISQALVSATQITGIYAVTIWFPVLIPLIFSVILWLFPLSIAGFFVKSEYNLEGAPINSKNVIAIIFIAIGIFRLSYALPDLLYWLSLHHQASNLGNVEFTPQNKASLTSNILEVAICTFLVVRSGAMANFVLRFIK